MILFRANRVNLLIFIIIFIMPNNIFGQDSLNYSKSGNFITRKPGIAITSGTIIYLGGIFYLNSRVHSEDRCVPFHFYNDIKSFLQEDKFEHAFGSYVESYIGYHWLRNAGVKKNVALVYGGTLGFILQSPKEIFDGFYTPGGFSWGDIAANAAGSALLIGQEILFDEQILKFKYSFTRSEYAEQANGYLGETVLQSFFHDHNGHTFWLSLNANNFMLKTKLPDWMNVAVGYSVNGLFGAYENINFYNGVTIPETQRYRQYLFSPDIDWTKIKTKSKFIRALLKGLVFIKMPFPAIEVNSKGQLKGYWIYF